ncbi:conserved hypothetical protein [Ricinus communis]|uniref:Uncharacterized protein n=1 Tax=Ricinus communis TaxID=3988 RepID=B9SD32_RICCO|nr:conserved hypothetical protein [Ricinus communis]
MGSETFLEVILAILLPPVGVFLRYGCGHFIVSNFHLVENSFVCESLNSEDMFICDGSGKMLVGFVRNLGHLQAGNPLAFKNF